MASAVSRLFELGLLHDAKVSSISIDYATQRLVIELDDFMANFSGEVSYPEPVKGSVAFLGIRKVEVKIEKGSREPVLLWSLSVFEIEAQQVGDILTFSAKFSPAGHISGEADSMEIVEPAH